MRKTAFLLFPVALAGLSAWAEAAPLTSGDIVVGVGFDNESTPVFAEFTTGGTLVLSDSINGQSGFENAISGITVGANSQPYVYVGNVDPILWTINSSNATSTLTTSAWSNVLNTAVGSLSAAGNYVYATSENAGNSTGGIFKFNLSTGTAQQLFDPNPLGAYGNTSYDKMTIGYNGELYGLQNNGGYSSPYLAMANAATGGGFAQTTLFESVNALAVDASGDLYVVRGDSSSNGEGIDELSPSFTLMRSMNFPNGTLSGTPNGIELSPTGNILVTSNGGTILETTTAFGSYTDFNVGTTIEPTNSIEFMQAAFVQAPVPEPATAATALLAASIILRRRPRRS